MCIFIVFGAGQKVKTTNVVEENKDAAAITIPDPKPEDVKEECNMDSAENGEAKMVEVSSNVNSSVFLKT